ncbi:MAG: restriction endonuclease subunit S [Anaerolineales bacterium]
MNNSPWPLTPLGEVIEQRKEFIRIDDFKTYKRCRVQLHAKGIVLRDEIDGYRLRTKKQQVCQPGEFLVAEIDAKVGGFGIVPPELEGAIVSSHYFLFVIDDTKLDQRFLDFFIRTHQFQDQVEAQGSTNYASIRPHQVLEYEIPLPPLAEQRRIVARIEALAAKVESARQLREEAQEEAEALLESSLASVFEEIDNKAETTGQLSDEEICELIPGRHILTKNYNRNQFGEPYITGPADFGEKFPTPTRWTPMPKVFAEPGDVLLTVKGAGVGKLNCAPSFSLCIGRQVMALRPNKERLVRDYLYYFLMSKYDYFQDGARSTTVPGLRREHVWDLELPLLPLSEQRRIVAHLDALQAKLGAVQSHQAATQVRLDALLPSILDQAFRGEL